MVARASFFGADTDSGVVGALSHIDLLRSFSEVTGAKGILKQS